jgi:hypothetical protein
VVTSSLICERRIIETINSLYTNHARNRTVIRTQNQTRVDGLKTLNMLILFISQMFGRKIARGYGVRLFPGLTFFRGGDPTPHQGNLLRTDEVVNFLTDEDALTLPDKIEVVGAEAMAEIIEEEDHVAVLFYDDQGRDSTIV